MQLSNEITVDASAEVLWEVLQDVERFAPYIPGFTLTEVDGDRYRGHMKVKVGAVTVQYDLEILVNERDADNLIVRAVASGDERKGAGTLRAAVVGSLSPNGDLTVMNIATELDVTGRVAQFGRSILAEVGAKLLARFGRDLEANVLASSEADSEEQVAPGAIETEPLDLVELAGSTVAKRIVPAAAGIVLLALLMLVRRSRRA